MVDTVGVAVLLDSRLEVAAHSVNKWRRERICGHDPARARRRTPAWQDCGAASSLLQFDA
jgi:hypothetical protein